MKMRFPPGDNTGKNLAHLRSKNQTFQRHVNVTTGLGE